MRAVRAFAVIAALVVAGSIGQAGEFPLVKHVDGYPKDFHRGEHAGFAVFHRPDRGWHLIVTSAGRRHHFKGKVWIEGPGKFGVIEQWKGEGEVKAEAGEHNWFHKSIKRHENDREFTFDIVEENKNVAGVNFGIEGEGKLLWELGIGGATDKEPVALRADRIFIGSEGKNPPSDPFMTFAHPDERGKGH